MPLAHINVSKGHARHAACSAQVLCRFFGTPLACPVWHAACLPGLARFLRVRTLPPAAAAASWHASCGSRRRLRFAPPPPESDVRTKSTWHDSCMGLWITRWITCGESRFSSFPSKLSTGCPQVIHKLSTDCNYNWRKTWRVVKCLPRCPCEVLALSGAPAALTYPPFLRSLLLLLPSTT